MNQIGLPNALDGGVRGKGRIKDTPYVSVYRNR